MGEDPTDETVLWTTVNHGPLRQLAIPQLMVIWSIRVSL